MEIKHKSEGNKGRFYIEKDNKIIAEMTYVWAGDTRIIIDHTEVDISLKGQGVGKKLVIEAVNFAREKGIKIMPLCPFAQAVFDKEKDFSDVLF
ncbi:MAG: GNAT family N-acetyltransferase [Bacteroidota bacterium]